MKILYMTGLYPPPETANGIRAYYFVHELIKRGHEVLVLEMTSKIPGAGPHFGEKVIRFPYPIGHVARALDIFKKTYVHKDMIRRTIEKYLKPDIVISSWPSHDSVLLGHILSTSLKVPLVLDIQDLSDHYSNMHDRGIITILMKTFIFDKVYEAMSMAWKVITVTEPFKRIIELRTNRKDVEVIYNGVDVEKFETTRSIIHEIKNAAIVGVFLGDLNWHYHMFDRILYALYFLKKSNGEILSNLKLKVIGSGRCLKNYKELTLRLGLDKMVIYTGYLNREELTKSLLLSDFGISGRPAIDNLWIKASIRTTIYEYIAAGLPIFSFGPKNTYTQYFVRENNLGVYVCSDDPKIIAAHMLEFLPTLKNFDRDDIRKVSCLYDWSKLAKKFATVIEKLST